MVYKETAHESDIDRNHRIKELEHEVTRLNQYVDIVDKKLAESEKRHNAFIDNHVKMCCDYTDRLNDYDKKLAIAKEALEYYGDPESWIERHKHSWDRSNPYKKDDRELIKDYHHPNTDWVGSVVVGGKRAREALKKLES